MSEFGFASLADIKPPVGRAAAYEFAGWKPIFLRPDGRPFPGWEATIIERVPLPAPLIYLDGAKVTKVAVHKRIVKPTMGALRDIHKAGLWEHLSPYGGGYEFRLQRDSDDGAKLSMHALGLALDFDPAGNPFKAPASETFFGETSEGREIVRLFGLWGWTWGGSFSRPDAMHFQFASGA